MRETIYLVGQISTLKQETFEWRKRVREYFENRSDFNVIDPCLDQFNTRLLEENPTDRIKIYQVEGVKLIVPRDRIYVAKSTIGFCNLNHYDKKKPLLGTVYELAWYFDAPDKATIGIFDGDPKDDIFCSHPFVTRTINVWVRNEMEACDLTEHYFKKTL